jgi:hypothetical protein
VLGVRPGERVLDLCAAPGEDGAARSGRRAGRGGGAGAAAGGPAAGEPGAAAAGGGGRRGGCGCWDAGGAESMRCCSTRPARPREP